MSKIIDTDTIDHSIEKREKWNFEDLFRAFEKVKLSIKLSNKDAQKIEDELTEIDRFFQDTFEKSKTNIAEKSFLDTQKLLMKWLSDKKHFEDKAKIKTLSQNLALLKSEIIHNASPSYKIRKDIEYYSKFIEDPSKSIYIEPIKAFLPTGKYANSKSFKPNIPKLPFRPLYYWDIKIEFKDTQLSLSIISEFLFILSSSIENNDGCIITIEDIKLGSIIVNCKVWFKNLIAKEETKKILDIGRRSAIGYVEKASSENEKIKKETEKTDTEIYILKKQLESSVDPAIINERERLINEKIKAEIEQIKIGNAKQKIESVKMLSELIGTGLIKQSNISIDINELLYYSKDSSKISIGEEIEKIDSGTKKIDK